MRVTWLHISGCVQRSVSKCVILAFLMKRIVASIPSSTVTDSEISISGVKIVYYKYYRSRRIFFSQCYWNTKGWQRYNKSVVFTIFIRYFGERSPRTLVSISPFFKEPCSYYRGGFFVTIIDLGNCSSPFYFCSFTCLCVLTYVEKCRTWVNLRWKSRTWVNLCWTFLRKWTILKGRRIISIDLWNNQSHCFILKKRVWC